MRFPFFSLRRKAKEDVAKEKLRRLCCFYTPTTSSRRIRKSDSDMTTVILDTTPTTTNLISSTRSEFSQTEQTLTGTQCVSSTRSELSSSEQHSRSQYLSRISSSQGMPADTPEHPRHSLRTFCPRLSSALDRETEAWDAMLPAISIDGIPLSTGAVGCDSPRKGPGLGSADDAPPTRMRCEARDDYGFEVMRIRHRRRSSGTQAPELPTRLEVCRDSTCGRRRQKRVPFMGIGLQRITKRSLGSHAIPESSSSLEESLSPQKRNLSPMTKMSQESISYEVASTCEETSSRAGCSLSPGHSSRYSSESTHPEDLTNHPTKQEMEKKWNFHENQAIACRDMEMKPTAAIEDQGKPHATQNAAPQLHQWQIHLSLDWASEVSNDLIAEVRVSDPKPSPVRPLSTTPPLRRCVQEPTTSSESSIGTDRTSCDESLTDREEDDDDDENESPHPEDNSTDSATSKESIECTHTANRSKTDNQTNVVYIVDRVLSELQKQKRSARNKQSAELGEMVDIHREPEKTTHGYIQTGQRRSALGTEEYREDCNSVQRNQARQEVLQAFEVLIAKKERKVAETSELEITPDTFPDPLSFLGGWGETVEALAEKLLKEAVFCDLHQEVSRMEGELKNKRPYPEKEETLTAALQVTCGAAAPRSVGKFTGSNIHCLSPPVEY